MTTTITITIRHKNPIERKLNSFSSISDLCYGISNGWEPEDSTKDEEADGEQISLDVKTIKTPK